MKCKSLFAASIFVLSGFANYVFAQPAQFVIEQDDNAFVIYKKEVLESGATTITEVISPNPELMEYVPDTASCFSTGVGSSCFINVRIKKTGPINFAPYDTSFIPYGIGTVDTVTNTPSINFNLWGFNRFFIADLTTEPTDSPAVRGPYVRFAGAEGSKVAETDEYIENRVLLRIQPVSEGKTFEYETYQVLASGIPFPDGEIVVWDTELLGDGFASTDGDKGRVSAMAAGEFYAFISDFWNQSPGVYAALRFFLNGTSEQDEGFDLTGFTTVEVTLNCIDGLVVEAFLGAGFDSSQTFLGDIVCDGYLNTYTFSVPSVDLTDIQTGVWLHIPLWKNTELDVFRVWMNVDSIVMLKP